MADKIERTACPDSQIVSAATFEKEKSQENHIQGVLVVCADGSVEAVEK